MTYHSEILSPGSHYKRLLGIVDGDGHSAGAVVPFPQNMINEVERVDDRRVVCLSDDGQLALISLPDGAVLAQAKVPKGINMKVAVLPRSGAIAVWGAALFVFDIKTLERRAAWDGMNWDGLDGQLVDRKMRTIDRDCGEGSGVGKADDFLHLERFMAEFDAGQVVAGLQRKSYSPDFLAELNMTEPPYGQEGMARIDLVTGAIEFALQAGKAASPCGRYVLGPVLADSPVREAGETSPVADDGTAAARDLNVDDVRREALQVELVSLWPPRSVRVLDLAWVESRKPSDVHTIRNRAWSTLMNVTWDADSTGFWFVNGKLKGGFRHVGLDGVVSPVVYMERSFTKGRKDDEADPGRVSEMHGRSRAEDLLPYRPLGLPVPTREGGGKIAVHAGEHRFFRFDESWMAASGQYVVILQAEDGYHRRVGDMTDPVIQAAIGHPVRIDALSEGEVRRALGVLVEEIRANFDGLVAGSINHSFELTFHTPDGMMDEPTFYARIHREGWDATDALASVMEAWHDGLCGQQGKYGWCNIYGVKTDLEYNADTTALALALRHVVLADRTRTDLLRDGLKMRDGEHESFMPYIIYPEYLRTHGFFSDEAVRLAIYHALICYRDREASIWSGLLNAGVIDHAARTLMPAVFAQMIFDECIGFEPNWQWNHQSLGPQYEEIVAGLGDMGQWMPKGRWGKACAAKLVSLRGAVQEAG